MPELKVPDVKLPAGMTEAEASKLFQTFITQRVSGKVKEKAQRLAMTDLKNLHKEEYQKLVDQYTPKS